MFIMADAKVLFLYNSCGWREKICISQDFLNNLIQNKIFLVLFIKIIQYSRNSFIIWFLCAKVVNGEQMHVYVNLEKLA